MRWSNAERRQWMFILFIGTSGLYAARAILPICSIALSEELKWDRSELGLLMGSFFWGYAMTQYLAGYLSDWLGGEFVISLTSLGWAILTLSFIWLPSVARNENNTYDLLCLARFLIGVFQGFYYPSLASLMARRVDPNERNFTYAVLNAGAHFGTLMCGSVGSYLVTHHGWRAPFCLIGLLFSCWSLTVYYGFVRPVRIHQASFQPSVKKQNDDAFYERLTPADSSPKKPSSLKLLDEMESLQRCGSIDPQSDASKKLLSSRSPRPLQYSLLLQQPAFWVMLLANFMHNNCFNIILNWCPSYFHDNFPDARSWVFNMVPWLIILPAVIIGGIVADRLIHAGTPATVVRKGINAVVLGGSAIFLFAISQVHNYYFSLACMALALACLGIHSSGVLLNPQDIAPNHSGKVYGIMSTVGTIPGFVGVYFTGYLLQVTHNWSYVFNLTAFLNVVGLLFYSIYASSDPLV